nr:MAG TPA: hypothetical protein [Caudoviricetes sp.]
MPKKRIRSFCRTKEMPTHNPINPRYKSTPQS